MEGRGAGERCRGEAQGRDAGESRGSLNWRSLKLALAQTGARAFLGSGGRVGERSRRWCVS